MSNIKIIQIGLLCENTVDEVVLKILIEKILAEKLFAPTFLIKKARTGIEGVVPLHAKIFFHGSRPVEIGVFVTDKDKSNKKEKKITESLNKICPAFINHCVIGIPDPHIEAWILEDENAVRQVFGLPDTDFKVLRKLSPKQKIEHFRSIMPDPRIALYRAYEDLAKNSDLKYLIANNSSFKRFADALLHAIKHV